MENIKEKYEIKKEYVDSLEEELNLSTNESNEHKRNINTIMHRESRVKEEINSLKVNNQLKALFITVCIFLVEFPIAEGINIAISNTTMGTSALKILAIVNAIIVSGVAITTHHKNKKMKESYQRMLEEYQESRNTENNLLQHSQEKILELKKELKKNKEELKQLISEIMKEDEPIIEEQTVFNLEQDIPYSRKRIKDSI